jgi:uncharacterized protein with PQ loop repeat
MQHGLHHLGKRRRGKQPLSRFDYLIYVAAVGAPIALFPQVLNIFITHDVSSLSLPTWALLGVFNILWIIYGLAHRDAPIYFTNFLLALLNGAVVIGILMYS